MEWLTINWLAATLAGIIGTAVMTAMMLGGRRLDLPAVDAHGILGYMQHADRASALGYAMHFILGILLAAGYGVVFRLVPLNLVLLGGLVGIIHWLAVGWMFALAPLAHAGMKAGTVPPTGPYMLTSLGVPGFVAGLIGHIAFGLVVGGVYTLLG